MAPPFRKRGDLIAEQIKQWIVSHNMQVGQKLPLEEALTEIFQVGKSSVREALKSLEVQGLIRTATGPNGGSFIAEVTDEHAMNMLQNFFYFKKLNADQIYGIRRTLEPLLAADIAERASDALIAKLEENVESCRPEARTREEWQQQLKTHIAFHDLLAQNGDNPLLCFHCKFVNKMVAQIVQSRESRKQRELVRGNFQSHLRLLGAIRRHDPLMAAEIMREHIQEIESYFPTLRPTVRQRFFAEPTPSVAMPGIDV